MPSSHDLDDGTFVLLLHEILGSNLQQISAVIDLFLLGQNRKKKSIEPPTPFSYIDRIPMQVDHLNRLVHTTDVDCIHNLRMDRNTFGRLCMLLRELGGLTDGRYVSVEEQVALFLAILSHHKKNRTVSFDFRRSGQTISYYVQEVLKSILKLNGLFLAKPTPIEADCDDPRWKYFKGCVGALDGTYINVLVSNMDKPMYRTRKGQIATNALACCDRNLRFIYVLSGWEGSGADGRVLRDAVNRENGLKVPRGAYYLCDNGYANCEGFLTPYKGVRYHLKEWGPECARPQNPEELFNLRHTKARNVIERAFGIMKMRWGILRSATYYPIKIQNRLIMACFLLHNFIRSEMVVDPVEELIDQVQNNIPNEDHDEEDDFIDAVETTPVWNSFRNELAAAMWHS